MSVPEFDRRPTQNICTRLVARQVAENLVGVAVMFLFLQQDCSSHSTFRLSSTSCDGSFLTCAHMSEAYVTCQPHFQYEERKDHAYFLRGLTQSRTISRTEDACFSRALQKYDSLLMEHLPPKIDAVDWSMACSNTSV